MEPRTASTTGPRPLRYRLVVEGRLDESWAGWFDCECFQSEGDRTVMEVEVIDQAQLHAVLLRVHDLHLRLVSATRLERSKSIPSEGGTP
jgi:hypothetical protein